MEDLSADEMTQNVDCAVIHFATKRIDETVEWDCCATLPELQHCVGVTYWLVQLSLSHLHEKTACQVVVQRGFQIVVAHSEVLDSKLDPAAVWGSECLETKPPILVVEEAMMTFLKLRAVSCLGEDCRFH